MVKERDPSRTSSGQYLSPQKQADRQPLANISARMQPSPKRTPDDDGTSAPLKALSQAEFGKASPLRNPLKKQEASLFIPKQPVSKLALQSRPLSSSAQQAQIAAGTASALPPQQRAFYLPGQAASSGAQSQNPVVAAAQASMNQPYQRSFEPVNRNVSRPTNPPPITSYPPSRPQFSSLGANTFYQPFQPPKPVVDLTKQGDDDDEDGFDPDAAIRESGNSFGAADPYSYVDSGQANENMKNLLEGAFDDNEDKSRIRLRKRAKKAVQQGNKKEANSLADKLASLKVQDEEGENAKTAVEEEEDEEEDGTVEGLTVKLLPHQVEGVAWMIEKEIGQSKKKGVLPNGGILADDMGLGKTVQSVALLLTNPRPTADAKPEFPKQKLPGKEVGKGTLVVAPLALIKQWEDEIKTKVSRAHALRVLVHHGPSRTKSPAELKRYDVVITTYQTLTSEHAGSNMTISGGARIGCFGVDWYRVMLDEAHSIKNRNAKSTQACYALNSWYRWCLTGTPMQNNLDELQSLIKFLRIKPYSELPNWKAQITQPMKAGRGGLAMRRLQVFLGAFMKRRTKDILKKDGALNFGGKAVKDGEGREDKKGGMQIVDREVLTVECEFDAEEQEFYQRLQERADKRLNEMQQDGNRVDAIGALVLLLRLRQACNHPHLIEQAMNKDKDAMTTGATNHKKGDDDMDDLAALMGGVSVETKDCDVCQARLSTAESRQGAVRCGECESLLTSSKKAKRVKKEKKKEEGKEKEKEKEKPRRKRHQLPDDSDEEGEGEWIAEGPEGRIDLGKAGGTDDEDAEGGGETLDSIDSVRSASDAEGDEDDSPPRAYRRQRRPQAVPDASDDEEEASASDASADSDASGFLHNVHGAKSAHKPSTKVRHLLRILHTETPKHKTIVFSQFTTMLDLIQPHLHTSGIRFVRYDGSMRNDAREAALHSLRTDPKTRVLLCSLKCGSLGLNLTAASRVVIVEPFWNPFVEEQAIDRVHRLNQTVNVKVFRLTVRDTVEERIIALQERKRELAHMAIEGAGAKGMGKLSMQEILGLFKHDAQATGEQDKEDREMWAKFGGGEQKGVLDAGGATGGSGGARVGSTPNARVVSAGGGNGRDAGRPVKAKGFEEHEVYGRRW
ncbi:hypothetical protein LTR08_002110 [Meristemomyces frigidus]|nr:hypothetical protein LTR08_002110 [Meristemomyces frigidus]